MAVSTVNDIQEQRRFCTIVGFELGFVGEGVQFNYLRKLEKFFACKNYYLFLLPIAVRLFFDLLHIEQRVPERKFRYFAISASEETSKTARIGAKPRFF